MKITILPKTKLGKVALILILGFIVFLAIFFIFIELGERGGEQFFSNLKLTIPFCIAGLCAVASFLTGFITTVKKERSVLVFICMVIGFLVLLWILAEFMFPH